MNGYRFTATFNIRDNKAGKWDTVTAVGDDRDKVIELARRNWSAYERDFHHTILDKVIRLTELIKPLP